MTQEEFQKNGPLQVRLAEILGDPAFQTAVSSIKDATDARAGDNDRDPVKKAALYDQRAGMNLLLSRLHALTKPPVERKSPQVRGLAKTINDLPPDP